MPEMACHTPCLERCSGTYGFKSIDFNDFEIVLPLWKEALGAYDFKSTEPISMTILAHSGMCSPWAYARF